MSADPMKAILDALPDPAPSPQIERVVMARIAQAAAARPAAAGTPVIGAESARTLDWVDASAWTAAVTGLVLFFGAWIAGQAASGALARATTSPAAAAAVLVTMPMNVPALLGLTIGAALYVAGLFVRSGPERERQP